jgi:hypothetical protein
MRWRRVRAVPSHLDGLCRLALPTVSLRSMMERTEASLMPRSIWFRVETIEFIRRFPLCCDAIVEMFLAEPPAAYDLSGRAKCLLRIRDGCIRVDTALPDWQIAEPGDAAMTVFRKILGLLKH